VMFDSVPMPSCQRGRNVLFLVSLLAGDLSARNV
jgi:hypothetical protein